MDRSVTLGRMCSRKSLDKSLSALPCLLSRPIFNLGRLHSVLALEQASVSIKLRKDHSKVH